jgi:hypothetical protein
MCISLILTLQNSKIRNYKTRQCPVASVRAPGVAALVGWPLRLLPRRQRWFVAVAPGVTHGFRSGWCAATCRRCLGGTIGLSLPVQSRTGGIVVVPLAVVVWWRRPCFAARRQWCGWKPFLLTLSGGGVVGAAASFPSWRRHRASWLPNQAPPWAGVVVVDVVLHGTLCEDAFLFLSFLCGKKSVKS